MLQKLLFYLTDIQTLEIKLIIIYIKQKALNTGAISLQTMLVKLGMKLLNWWLGKENIYRCYCK